MTTYAALLRGVNLGARNRIGMAELRELVEGLGGEGVRTYVQSGNVVLRSRLTPAKLEQALSESIRRALDLDVAVLVRTAAQLARLVVDGPFPKADPATLHVTFLAANPDTERVHRLHGRDFRPDELRLAGDAAYLHCPNGYGRSKLSNAFIEKQLDVVATTRNWTTVTALAELTAG